MSPIVDAVLLFSLSVPIVMKYRILPVSGTPYWLFGLVFLLLLSNIILSYKSVISSRLSPTMEALRNIVVWLVLAVVLVGVSLTAMEDRHTVAPVWGVHDIILQEEAALRYLLQGKNPYKETYFGTPVETFHYAEIDNEHATNPALYHFVMPPWYLLFPIGFYVFGVKTFGFFDARMASLFCMVGLLFVLWHWVKDKNLKRFSIVLVSLSPSMFDYFIEGRSDIFAFFWLSLSLYILSLKRPILSAFVFGLAMMSKQTIWLVAPFYLLYMYHLYKNHVKTLWVSIAVFVCVMLTVSVPFLLWDGKAFIDSVVLYLTGGTAGSYPVSGYGLSMILYSAGVIKNIHDQYPFYFFQFGIGLPLLWILLKWLWQKPMLSTLLFSYGIFLTVFWYMSRYFNNSHVGYISLVFLVAGILFMDEKSNNHA